MLFQIATFSINAQNLPYINQTDVGLLFGDNDTRSFSLQAFNGVAIDKLKIHLGFVTGIDIYQPLTFVPLAPSLKYLPFSNKKTNLYFGITAGYAFGGLNKLEDNQSSNGGILVHPALGLRFKTKRKAAFNFNLGYKVQKGTITTFTESLSQNPRLRNRFVNDYTFKRVSFTLGLSF